MNGRDGWDEPRESYDRVVESIDAVVRRHPAGSDLRETEADEAPTVKALPDNVVDLRARRLATAYSGGYPDDAA